MENLRTTQQNFRSTLQDTLKSSAPVRTGNLRKSITVVENGENLDVYALDYAKYVMGKHIDEGELDKKLDEYAEGLIEGIWNDIAKEQ